jgi:scyllo-inositol 2-dehydrogenase (NADP+)
MRKLRAVVVGLGRIGWQFHLPEISRQDGYDLVGVVDPIEDRRSEAETKYGVAGFADLQTCLDQVSPDLVVIASPTPLHAEQAEMAFTAGSHVFCDKPMAPDLATADRMIAAAEKHTRRLMMYQPERGSREVVGVRSILAQGLIGDIYLIKHTRTQFTRRNDWQAWREHGGGMLNNYGAHLIDACMHLAGSPVRDVTCHLRTIATLGDADDVVKALLRTESDILLDIDINMASAQPMQPRWHILGHCGSLRLNDKAGAWEARWFDPEQLPPLTTQEGLAAEARRYGSGEQLPWQEASFDLNDCESVDFYAEAHSYFAEGAEALIPVDESRELMRVLSACRADAARHESNQQEST